MGDKISQLSSATTLTGTELVPVVQGGTTKKATSADFKTTNAADLISGTVAAARLPVGSQVNPGILQLGTLSGQACAATDSRLSDSRTPSGVAGGDLAGTYPNPQLAASGVTAGTFGSGSVVPQITVDSKGRVTNVAQSTIPIPQPSTTNPLPNGIAGAGSSSLFAREDHIHQASSTTLTGDVTGTGTGSVATALSNTGVSQGTYGSSNLVPVVTVDAKGRVLAVSETPFSSTQGGTVTSVDASGGSTGLTVSGGPINAAGTLTLGGTLSVASGGTGATSAAAALTSLGALPASLKGVANGVADLDSGGKVPYSQLPGALGSSPVATLDGNGKVPLSQLYAGTASGLATLDTGGKVPSAQLPSYVDDIIEVPSSANFPNPGETGKIYVTLDTNLTYRWSGSGYVQVSSGPLPSNTSPLVNGSADPGTSLTYSRSDHVHPTQAGAATPLVASGTGSVGTSSLFAREDHVHPAQALAASGVSAGNYGNSSSIPIITVDQFGRITAASTQSISGISSSPQSIEYLIVAGGGSGAGQLPAGGGGAGGVRTGVASIVSGVQLIVTVGAGGASFNGTLATIGNNGNTSSIIGGGVNLSCSGGGSGWGGAANSGAAGGSGGGGGQVGGGAGNTPILTWLPSQGNNGGVQSASSPAYGGGGGGGAGSVGGNGSSTNGGNGGVGISSSITGSAVFYGGGGGGGAREGGTAAGAGGNGGGGSGALTGNPNATSGTANTGGGGGGCGTNAVGQGVGNPGAGGSGIVVIRYPSLFLSASSVTGTFTESVSGGFRVYSFTGNGTITF